MELTINRISAVCLLALAPAAAMASMTPVLQSVVPTAGGYLWTYTVQAASDQDITSGLMPTLNPVGSDLGLGGVASFALESQFNLEDLISYAAIALKNSGLQAGSPASNVGFTAGPQAPAAVPEPPTLALMLAGLGIAGVTRRKVK